MCAIDPPPAPIVSTSIDGKMIGWPNSTDHSLVIRSEPPCTSDRSVLVPPMSRPMASAYPHWAATCRAAIAPAAIPLAASRTG